MSTDILRIGEKARKEPELVFTSLYHHITDVDNLRACYDTLNGKRAIGIDGITKRAYGEQLEENLADLSQRLKDMAYRPQPKRRTYIPKPGSSKERPLAISCFEDKLVELATKRTLEPIYETMFLTDSHGYRPERNQHGCLKELGRMIQQEPINYIVEADIRGFFDRVNHDKMMSLVMGRIADRRVRRLIRRYLKAGMYAGDVYTPRSEGTPQGGPLSPLLANLLLDQLDRELGRRGHRFVRYADDVSIYVKSERAGRRVLQSISDFLSRKLKLKINESKSRVDKPRNRSLLGFSIGRAGRVFVSDKSIWRLKDRIRELTGRNRGRRIEQIIREVGDYLRGWRQYFNYAYNKQKFRELTAWINRRLRCYMWKQWGKAGYRELRKRGVSRQLAWNTGKSHHGPWRLSRSPALSYALTTRHFAEMGLPLPNVNV